jgi:glutamate-1-semialdehyde 2,1-aminomutase
MGQNSPFRPGDRETSIRTKTPGSAERFRRASSVLPGGVSSAVRRAARPYPLYFRCGQGARVVDVDNNPYFDYTLAWGPLFLGHAPAAIADAIAAQARQALTYGAQHDLEIEVAERLVKIIPCADAVCFANSGTEIVQLALRLARAATGCQKYIKFEGHYHGWDDSVLISYHPTAEEIAAAQDRPIPVGVGQLPARTPVIAEWNNRASVEAAFRMNPGKISALICEPLVCNSGSLPPEPGFLAFLREITTANGALLIFDEVITGFRVALGGAQELYGVTPDLATYAKAVGAGVPLSVLAGKRQYMDLIAQGGVIHAGSLNGNPLSLAAAGAALDVLTADGGSVYKQVRRNTERLRYGLEEILQSHGLTAVTNGECGVFHIAFMDRPALRYRDTLPADTALYSDFALALLDEGVLVLPDGRWYVSTAHTEADIDATLDAAACAFRSPSEMYNEE